MQKDEGKEEGEDGLREGRVSVSSYWFIICKILLA